MSSELSMFIGVHLWLLLLMPLSIRKRRQKARGDVEQYADRALRSLLGWGEGAIVVDDPPHGARSLIYFAHPTSSRSVAIQAFEKPTEARRFVEVLKLARTHDLPVPQLIHSSLGWAPSIFGTILGRIIGRSIRHSSEPYIYLVTEFAPGSDLASAIDEAKNRDNETDASRWNFVVPLAEAVARLHSVRNPRWGKPGRLKRSSIRKDWRSSVESRLKDIFNAQGHAGGRTKDVEKSDADRMRRWFAAAIDRIDEPTEFNLCHHHLAADDILYDSESGRITIVDCASLQFSRAARDLAALRMGLFEGADEAWALFRKSYDAASPGREMERLAEELRFFEAFYLLIKLRSAIGSPDRFAPRLDALLVRIGED